MESKADTERRCGTIDVFLVRGERQSFNQEQSSPECHLENPAPELPHILDPLLLFFRLLKSILFVRGTSNRGRVPTTTPVDIDTVLLVPGSLKSAPPDRDNNYQGADCEKADDSLGYQKHLITYIYHINAKI